MMKTYFWSFRIHNFMTSEKLKVFLIVTIIQIKRVIWTFQNINKVKEKNISYPSCIGQGKKCLENGRGWDRKGVKRNRSLKFR